tara:strand:+ start:537 stop:716 length:180 start_codon:yes stop_codon:yes gene_type:complete
MTDEDAMVIREALDLLAATMIEHDTAEYEPDEENPWTMREFFGEYERDILARAQYAMET